MEFSLSVQPNSMEAWASHRQTHVRAPRSTAALLGSPGPRPSLALGHPHSQHRRGTRACTPRCTLVLKVVGLCALLHENKPLKMMAIGHEGLGAESFLPNLGTRFPLKREACQGGWRKVGEAAAPVRQEPDWGRSLRDGGGEHASTPEQPGCGSDSPSPSPTPALNATKCRRPQSSSSPWFPKSRGQV